MSKRSLPFVFLMTAPAWLFACGAEPPPIASPETPTTSAVADAPPTTPTVSATADAPAAPVTPPVVEAPPKPAKEKIVGQWQFSFEGEPKAKAEEDAKKKFPKDKDQAKRDAFIKKIADAAAGEWIEFADGTYVSHTTDKGKDKVVAKMKYDVVKDENTKLTVKAAGKDEISKKAMKDEVSIAFTDDNTITMTDPKRKMNLIFKRK